MCYKYFVSSEVKAFGQSNVGRVRSSNEDSWGVFPELRFFVVADGMGGHAAGEVASKLAVETMADFIKSTLVPDEVTWPGDLDLDPDLSFPAKRLIAAGKLANSKIFHDSQADSKLSGMGTTMVCVLIEGDKAYVAHVGDSRAYLIRNGTIDQVTNDHSLINDYIQQGILKPEEADQHPLKHVITRALGSNVKVEVDVKTIPLSGNDTFLLCSDGLSNLVNGQEMKEAGFDSAPDLESACGNLVELANNRGGDDNITIVMVSSTRK